MYSVGTTALKFVIEYLKHAGMLTAAQIGALQIPETPQDWTDTNTVLSLGLALVPAFWRALENYRKNGNGPNGPVWRWPWSKAAMLLLCCSLVGAPLGCSTIPRDDGGTDVVVDWASVAQGLQTGLEIAQASYELWQQFADENESDYEQQQATRLERIQDALIRIQRFVTAHPEFANVFKVPKELLPAN